MPTTFEDAFAAVKKLAKNFKDSETEYLEPAYNEESARNDFINKFFDALGWDASNNQHKPPSKQEVKLNRNVAVGLSQRFADYAFYVSPNFRKQDVRFFGEAKKPAVELITPDHCFQTIRYGWNADNTPLAVLTSFRQMVVLDCRTKPDIKTAAKRIVQPHAYAYTDYADPAKFREIFNLLSRDAVAAGSLAAFAESRPGKLPIGDAFLQELDACRGTLARAFKNRNPNLDGEMLTEITQRTLDRLVFLRFLEDKGIETKDSVANFMRRGTPWLDFVSASKRLNGIYNGIVFRPHKLDEPDFQVDDGAFAEVCQWLSDPYSPYLFNIIPIHILGSIYEQFLGKVIVTTDKRARVEEKPEVRKAGGVHYTPEYIARYIVENTVGKLIAGKTPAQIAEMRFLDISSGSGSFLLAVYDLLLQYHRDWFNANQDKAKKAGCIQHEDGEWHLSLQQRREILLNNIYGVDIDAQAVEVCQLSLYLKLLEEETTGTASAYQMEFHETLLPSLSKNIVCGNSLIGNDFSLDLEERRKVKAMDFEQRFPEIMKRRFDAIVGNPPYIRIQTLQETTPQAVSYFGEHYQSAGKGNYDIYVVFVERALDLLNPNGQLGYILPHKFFNMQYGEPLRRLLAEGQHLKEIVHFGDQQVFEGASTYTCLLFLTKTKSLEFLFRKAGDLEAWRDDKKADEGRIEANRVTSSDWNFVVGAQGNFFEKLKRIPTKLADVATGMFVGLQTSADTVFLFKDFREATRTALEVFSKESNAWVRIEKAVLKRVIRSGSIGRYFAETTAWTLFPYAVANNEARIYTQKEMCDSFPLAWAYLQSHKCLLESREKGAFKDSEWYRYGRTQNLGMWEQPKLLVPYMITELSAFDDQNEHFYFINVTTGGYGITLNEKFGSYRYICGLLNSSLLDFYLKQVSTNFRGGYFAANKQFIEQLPIRTIDFSKTDDRARHDRMVALVEQMLAAKKQLAGAQSDADKDFYGNTCAGLDREIDALVYALYGLTAEEIAIVDRAGHS